MLGQHQILIGDVLEQLGSLADESVQCVVTSPPYWGLRDYGTAQWEGGDAGCDHIEKEHGRNDCDAENLARRAKLYATGQQAGSKVSPVQYRSLCRKCGARRIDAQLGLEPTPEAHVEAMVGVFREVRRVLRGDGVCWLNYGDCYAGSWGAQSRDGDEAGISRNQIANHPRGQSGTGSLERTPGLKPKDLVGMPWRVAFALQADGWWLRSALPWVKRSAMPESCTDRPASALEYVFLLTKSARYFFDMEAVRQKAQYGFRQMEDNAFRSVSEQGRRRALGTTGGAGDNPESGRAYRNTDLFYQSLQPPHGLIFAGDEPVGLDVNPQPFSEAHFATFPERLVEPLIKCGSGEGDTVLDPFAGSGTTLLVANRLGRDAIGIELNQEYAAMAEDRIGKGLRPSTYRAENGHAPAPLFEAAT